MFLDVMQLILAACEGHTLFISHKTLIY